jgi:hypothetical protein
VASRDSATAGGDQSPRLRAGHAVNPAKMTPESGFTGDAKNSMDRAGGAARYRVEEHCRNMWAMFRHRQATDKITLPGVDLLGRQDGQEHRICEPCIPLHGPPVFVAEEFEHRSEYRHLRVLPERRCAGVSKEAA